MTESEAIKVLEEKGKHIEMIKIDGKDTLCYRAILVEAFEVAQKALEKQIAKKPLGEYTQCKCSVCGRRVRSGRGSSSFVRDNFCQRCGQKLDWE